MCPENLNSPPVLNRFLRHWSEWYHLQTVHILTMHCSFPHFETAFISTHEIHKCMYITNQGRVVNYV